jgi:hypothetical protein
MNRNPWRVALAVIVFTMTACATSREHASFSPNPDAPTVLQPSAQRTALRVDGGVSDDSAIWDEIARTVRVPREKARKAVPRTPNDGGMVTASVWELREPIDLWHLSSLDTGIGWWWALSAPRGKLESFRREMALCEGWNSMRRLVHCRIPAGTRILAGRGRHVPWSHGPHLPDNRIVAGFRQPAGY